MKKPFEILCVTLLILCILCILLNLYTSHESYRCPCGIRRKTGR